MDVCVTLPISFGLEAWIAEGDPAGIPWSGEEWHFYLWGTPPHIAPGERVYIVFRGALRGYAPLVRIDRFEGQRYGLVRHGGAVAVSIPEYIPGFRGFRYRWWEYDQERPFPEWQDRSARLVIPADEAMRRARDVPYIPPLDELTQELAKAEAAKQPRERPVFGDPTWMKKRK
jgi:hypothetical protein